MSTRELDTRLVITCRFCGHEFLAKQRNRTTCSDKCRKRLSRWRQTLTAQFKKALSCVDEMATYLKHEDARHIAIKAFAQLKAEIDRTLADNKVKRVS